MIDENLPPPMARSLNALFKGTHDVQHLRDKFGPCVPDVEWIESLNAEGGWVVISADRRISKNKTEQRVFRASKSIAFIFAPSLQKASLLKKMERLMAMWQTIEKQVELVEGGAMFEIPIKGKLKQI